MRNVLNATRVLELAHMVAGPLCGQLFANLGATVVKVEPLPAGDAARHLGPKDSTGNGVLFGMYNSGKQSIAVDLRTSDGRSLLRRLLEEADCLITNFHEDALRSLGIDREEIESGTYGDVTMLWIPAFYPDSPRASDRGVDITVMGLSGSMWAMGTTQDPPLRPAVPVADITAGLLCAFHGLAALLNGAPTHEKSVVMPLMAAAELLAGPSIAYAASTGVAPPRLGSGSTFGVADCFQTSDGWITLAVPTAKMWSRLKEAFNIQTSVDPFSQSYFEPGKHAENWDRLRNAIQSSLADYDSYSCMSLLKDIGIPSGPVVDPLDIARDLGSRVTYDTGGTGRMGGANVCTGIGKTGSSTSMASRNTWPRSRQAPRLGQDSLEVLHGLGIAKEEVRRLIVASVISEGEATF